MLFYTLRLAIILNKVASSQSKICWDSGCHCYLADKNVHLQTFHVYRKKTNLSLQNTKVEGTRCALRRYMYRSVAANVNVLVYEMCLLHVVKSEQFF